MRNHPTKAGRSIEFELLASLDLDAGICVFIMRTQVKPLFCILFGAVLCFAMGGICFSTVRVCCFG